MDISVPEFGNSNLNSKLSRVSVFYAVKKCALVFYEYYNQQIKSGQMHRLIGNFSNTYFIFQQTENIILIKAFFL